VGDGKKTEKEMTFTGDEARGTIAIIRKMVGKNVNNSSRTDGG